MNIDLSQSELGFIEYALALAALHKERDARLFRDAGFLQHEAVSHTESVVYARLATGLRQKGLCAE
jgi:hypothetical protein